MLSVHDREEWANFGDSNLVTFPTLVKGRALSGLRVE